MTRILRLLLALAGLLALPIASAHHWEWDTYGDGSTGYFPNSTCSWSATNGCQVQHFCLGNAPPQVVDTALHCANRAGGRAGDTAAWLPHLAWFTLEGTAWTVEDRVYLANSTTTAQRATVNAPLCATVWSFFCTNPLFIPEHVPLEDPLRGYPL